MKARWTVALKNGMLGGLMPQIDPFDKTVFYISDGWGASYPSMKLRQLSFSTGEELKSASIKNSVRCLYFKPDEKNILAVSDSKIFWVDRIAFSITNKIEKGIQKYSDFISSNDSDTILCMNSNSDFLFVYNYDQGKVTKNKLRSCSGIFKEDENTFLIFCPRIGSVQQYELSSNKLHEILKTDVFYKTYKSRTGNFYLHLGKIVKATPNTHERIEPLNSIAIYSKSDWIKKSEISIDVNFDTCIVSDNEEKIYLIKDNGIVIYSLVDKQIIQRILLNDNVRVAQVFDVHNLFISYEYDTPNLLTCWEF